MIKSKRTHISAYKTSDEYCWSVYNRDIAYQPLITDTEMVLLRGRFEGVRCIKIPVEKDTREFKSWLSSELNIRIANQLFTSQFDLFGNKRDYRVYRLVG